MDYSTTPISRCRRDIFQWIEQPAMKRAPVYPPSTMTAVDYMPLYPQLDISSYSTVSSNFPSPPSETFLVSQRRTPVQDTSALVHTSEDVNESLWWVHPYPLLQVVPGCRQVSVRREDLLQGLALKYKDASFALCVRRFLVLAFVPPVDDASKGDRSYRNSQNIS